MSMYSSEERNKQDAESYAEVPKLPVLSADEINDKMSRGGFSRMILASYRVDESDCMSDYHGSRTVRQIVIGFGKGVRESFKQLREAAASFPPTDMYAPGYDRYLLSLTWDHNFVDHPDRAWMDASQVQESYQPRKDYGVLFHYYRDMFGPEMENQDSRFGFQFSHIDALNKFKAENPAPAGTVWNVSKDSYENRENYSMGGGNYLGAGRYHGWIVNSYRSADKPYEFHEPVAKKSKKSSVSSDPVSPVVRLSDLYAANV